MRYSYGFVGSDTSGFGDVDAWDRAVALALDPKADVVSVVHDNEARRSHVLRGETDAPLRYPRG